MTHDPFLMIWGTAVVLFVWVLLDFKGWVRFVKRNHQLDHEGRWDELEALLQKELRAFRPWVHLALRVKSPGCLQALAAAFYFQRGRVEDSLRLAEAAARKSRANHTNFPEILRLQVLGLTELARYDEARDVVSRMRSLGATASADFSESLLCLYLGRLDHALALAQRAAQDPKADLARGLASIVLLTKGDYKPALEVLLDPPRDVTTYYTAEDLRKLARSSDGRAMVEGHRKVWAGVVEPLRFLDAAYVYLELGDVEELRFSLDKAAGVMGGNLSLKVIHEELNACLCAMAGDAAGAERRLQRGAEILKTHPRRTSRMEFHRYAGRAHLLLGRGAAALTEFETSLELALHPLEKHVGRYWLARAHEAQGDKDKAAELDRAVAADGISSKYATASPR